jgi:hypothetical protein
LAEIYPTHPTGIIYKSLRGIVCPSSQAYR